MKITEDIKIKEGTGLVIFINGTLFLMVYATISEFKLGALEPVIAFPFLALFSFLAIRKIKKLPSTFIAQAAAISDDNDVPFGSTDGRLLGSANDPYNRYMSHHE